MKKKLVNFFKQKYNIIKLFLKKKLKPTGLYQLVIQNFQPISLLKSELISHIF